MNSIERDILIAAPPERVYEIVTQPEHIGRWFGDAGAEREGDTITMRWEEHGSAQLRVVQEEPPHAFAYRWDSLNNVGETLVEFRLEPEGDGTRLKVTESGWESLNTTPSEQERLRQGNDGGWEHELGDLERYAQSVTV
jgi:uncharacterized protein YndB with AHSA1/START domain